MKSSAAFGAALAAARPALAMTDNLSVLNSNVPWANAITGRIAEEFTGATGIGFNALEHSYSEHATKIVVEMVAQSKNYDIITSDAAWMRQPIENGWAVPFGELAEKYPDVPPISYEKLAPASLTYLEVDDKVWGLPVAMTTPVFVYRRDLLDAAGIEVPRTWEEFNAAAAKLHSDEVSGSLILGANIADSDFNFRMMSMRSVSNGNDGYMSEDGEPIFNSEGQAAEALELIRELAPYCSEGWVGFDYAAGSSLMQQGKVAMMVCWSDVLVGLEDGPYRGKFGYTVSPVANVQQQAIGGWGMYVNRYSEQQESAYRFMKWMSQGRGYELMREAGESSLVLQSDFEDPEVLAQVPMLQTFAELKTRNVTTCPFSFYRQVNAAECMEIMQQEINGALVGRKTSAEAMDDATRRIAEIT
jgi:ABC-type glycerol-3-phosphate transport system substrate-binding protein